MLCNYVFSLGILNYGKTFHCKLNRKESSSDDDAKFNSEKKKSLMIYIKFYNKHCHLNNAGLFQLEKCFPQNLRGLWLIFKP